MRKAEKIFVIAILVLSLSAMGVMRLAKSNNAEGSIIVKVDNQIVREVPINYSDVSKIYDFQFHNHTGQIDTKNGSVRIIRMSRELCPNGICADTGWINKTYQSIVCLPNRIVITIQKDTKEDDKIDIVI